MNDAQAASTRGPFVHESIVVLGSAGDPQALGAAVTVALCGHWEHEPPCPLAPHHSAAETDGERVRLRTVFAVEPHREAEVRQRIERALGRGALTGRDGSLTSWRLVSSQRSDVGATEVELATRLCQA